MYEALSNSNPQLNRQIHRFIKKHRPSTLTMTSYGTSNGNGNGNGVHPPSAPYSVAKLAFNEITLGRVVGEGGFCTVSEITSVDLDELYDDVGDEEETKNRKDFRAAVNQRSTADRYVLKTLRNDLVEEDHVKGVLDLAIEAEFLRVLHHENICSMRGMANSDPHTSRFFVCLTLLPQTLEKRFNYWRKQVGENTGYWFPVIGYCCAKSTILQDVWLQRLQASMEIASALAYLHGQRIVYRDLKPDNIGLSETGTIKIFDFGLAKRFDTVEKNLDGRYLLTGNTGSLRYMAPEVAKDQPYTLSVDAYSFGIIFWQICSLTTPFAGYSQKTHSERVIHKGERPVCDASWPRSWVDLMEQCWNQSPQTRPTADAIVQSVSELYHAVESEGVLSRAAEIRAKNRKSYVASVELDVDTRISNGETDTTKRFDAPIV
jgi:serine/threonine protein kinase